MAIDRTLRNDICKEVKAVMERQLCQIDEVWLTEKNLLEQFQMFTHDWLRRYGETLPRTRVVLTSASGERRQSAWAYGRNQIQRMIFENKLRQLKIEKL